MVSKKLVPVMASCLILAGASACGRPAATGITRSTAAQDRTAPQEGTGDLIRSDYAPGELKTLCKEAIDRAQERMDAIANLSPSQRTFDNTVLAFENANADLNDAVQPMTFMNYVSPVKTTNAEALDCTNMDSDFVVKTEGRRDLYNALKDEKPRNADETRLLKKTLEEFEANGLKLPDDKLAQVTKLLAQLSQLENTYNNNLNNDTSTVEYTKAELDGVSGDFLSTLKRDGDKYVVTTKVTDYDQVMNNVKSSAARKAMMFAYNNRQGVANTKLLEQAIMIREQVAKLMGFKTWADYQLSHGRMAKNAQEVFDFLNGLKGKLAERDHQDLAQLLAFKKMLDPNATQVDAWDIQYLQYQLQKRDYSLDEDKIREYFPSDVVVQGMFKVYSQLLGVKFEQVAGAHAWSPDVQLYRIINQADNRLIGYFYTDFIPRPGKYEHFASFPLIGGRMMPGGYNHPVAAIVGNFPPPANGKPSLLSHDDVVTVFHEFGHIMHQTLTQAPYASLSGANVAQDFVEAPSQMLENWPWEAKILNTLSGYYKDPSQKLPADLLKKMIQARDFQQGYFYTRQLMLALTDMTYHTTTGPVDTAAIYDKLFKDVIGVDPIQGGHFSAAFGHLMGGYDAGYYGYLWSQVYAADMFTVFQNTDVLDPATGAKYRKIILEKGNMEDAGDLLTQFLGRPSNNKAFLKKLHINE